MNPDDKLKYMGMQSKETMDRAAGAAQDALSSPAKVVHQAGEKLSDQADDVRSQVAPMLDKVSDAANSAMTKARESWHDASAQMREQAQKASDVASGYAKDEPLKALLISAATGALLMGLIGMMARSRD